MLGLFVGCQVLARFVCAVCNHPARPVHSVECEGRVCEFVCSSVGRGGKAGSRPDYDDRDIVE